jgi:hypothetical protein
MHARTACAALWTAKGCTPAILHTCFVTPAPCSVNYGWSSMACVLLSVLRRLLRPCADRSMAWSSPAARIAPPSADSAAAGNRRAKDGSLHAGASSLQCVKHMSAQCHVSGLPEAGLGIRQGQHQHSCELLPTAAGAQGNCAQACIPKMCVSIRHNAFAPAAGPHACATSKLLSKYCAPASSSLAQACWTHTTA